MKKKEFTERVLGMEGRLYRVSCAMLRNPQNRMDAVQEAILRAWAGVDKLREVQYFETWLTRILVNVCRDMISKQGRAISMEGLPEPGAAQKDGAEELREALDALELELRLPLVLHYMEGYRVREIAEILGLPEGTVKTRMARGKRELRALLKEDEA